MKCFDSFLNDECGAVTVDWVVLTAAIVGMGTIVVTTIANGATDVSNGIGAQVGNMDTSLADNDES